MELNVFENLKDITVNESMPIVQWLTDIKMGRHTDKVMFLRGLSDEKDIKKFKANYLPCIIYNVALDKERNTENIISGTGYFFIDIDVPFDTRLLNRSKIFALYKSCSGDGIHIIVQVDGLTKENYHSAYDFICDNLGITEYVDKGAKKIVQPSLTSYDPDLFFNYNSLKFDLSKLVSVTPPIELLTKTNKKETFSQSGGVERINFNSASLIDFGGKEYIADWQNIDFIECRLTGKTKEGKRHNKIFAYGANLVWLNPTLTKEKLSSILHNFNQLSCDVPLEYKEIVSMINTLVKYKEEGKLKPLYKPKKRSIVFDPDAKLTYEQKMDIVYSVRREKCAKDSTNKLNDIIEDWDFKNHGPISQSKIVKNYPISKKTVEKYYKEFKNYIQELNYSNNGK